MIHLKSQPLLQAKSAVLPKRIPIGTWNSSTIMRIVVLFQNSTRILIKNLVGRAADFVY